LGVEEARRACICGGASHICSRNLDTSARVEEVAFCGSSVCKTLKIHSVRINVLLQLATNGSIVALVKVLSKSAVNKSSTTKIVCEIDQGIKHVLIEGSSDIVSNTIDVASNVFLEQSLALGSSEAFSRVVLVVSNEVTNANSGVSSNINVITIDNTLPLGNQIKTSLSNGGWVSVGVASTTCWWRSSSALLQVVTSDPSTGSINPSIETSSHLAGIKCGGRNGVCRASFERSCNSPARSLSDVGTRVSSNRDTRARTSLHTNRSNPTTHLIDGNPSVARSTQSASGRGISNTVIGGLTAV